MGEFLIRKYLNQYSMVRSYVRIHLRLFLYNKFQFFVFLNSYDR